MRRVLGEFPRHCFIYVLVRPPDKFPHELNRVGQLNRLHEPPIFPRRIDCLCAERLIKVGALRRRQEDFLLELANHVQRAVQKISEVVGEVGVDSLNERVAIEVAVKPQSYFAQEKISDSVRAEFLNQKHGVDDVALRHFIAVGDKPAVSVNLLRQRHSSRHEHCRPDYRVETHNLLADQVNVRRPEFFHIGIVNQRRDIVDNRVKPNVNDMPPVVGHGYAPIKRRARYAQVLQPALNETDHLVAPRRRHDKFGVLLNVL